MIAAKSIKAASRALEKEVQGHAKKLRKAGVMALNKTTTKGRNVASRTIRDTLNVKAAAVKKQLGVRRASPQKMRSAVQGKYKPLPLIQFNGVRQTKKGVSVKMRKDMPRKIFKGAFIQVVGNGHRGVFRRVGKSRLPIKEIYGPSVHAIFGDKIGEIVNKTAPDLEKTLNHEINYELSKK